MKKTTLIILVCIAIVLGMVGGIIYAIMDRNNLQEAQINEIRKVNELIEANIIDTNKLQDEIIATSGTDVKLSPNAYIIFEKYYTDCGHTIIQKEKVQDNEVNKDEEYFKNAYSDWKIESFTADEVKLYKEFQGDCDEHYLITIDDENIVVYSVDNDGNRTLKEKTDIPVQYLPNEDIELLQKGITAYGQNELAKKLEDFE